MDIAKVHYKPCRRCGALDHCGCFHVACCYCGSKEHRLEAEQHDYVWDKADNDELPKRSPNC